MMDETTDISGKERITIIVLFVDNEESIQERLIGFSVVSRTDSETLLKLLKDTSTSEGLNLLNIRGQCYDGDSNMSGEHQGLRSKLKHLKLFMSTVMHTALIWCYSGFNEEHNSKELLWHSQISVLFHTP